MGSCTATCLLVATVALALSNVVTASELVPVYLWETAKSNEVVPAIGHTSMETFTDLLYQKIEKYNPYIVVFAEPNLSPEDFIDQGKTTFQQISKISKSPYVSYLPLVSKPIEAIKGLPAKSFAEISVNDITSKLPESRVLIIHFNDAKEDEDRVDMLKRHDALIAGIYKNLLKEHKDVLAIFTGIYSSLIVPEEIKNQRQSRDVLAEAEAETPDLRVFKNAGNFTFFMNGYVSIETETADATTPEFYTVVKVSTDENDNILTITLNNTKTMQMNVTLEEDMYWYLYSFKYENNEYMPRRVIAAPNNFGYHCDSQNFTFTKGQTTTIITFQGLQFQLFSNGTSETTPFGDAYDCVGFTTAPIWSGLFITLILALIMTLGLTMMMDIKTMDRFDDPKGKTIIINAE